MKGWERIDAIAKQAKKELAYTYDKFSLLAHVDDHGLWFEKSFRGFSEKEALEIAAWIVKMFSVKR